MEENHSIRYKALAACTGLNLNTNFSLIGIPFFIFGRLAADINQSGLLSLCLQPVAGTGKACTGRYANCQLTLVNLHFGTGFFNLNILFAMIVFNQLPIIFLQQNIIQQSLRLYRFIQQTYRLRLVTLLVQNILLAVAGGIKKSAANGNNRNNRC